MNWGQDDAPVDPLSAAAGRAAAERSGDPRFAPIRSQEETWGLMDAPQRSEAERATRLATSVPQGVNQGLYKGVMALPDILAALPRLAGLVGEDTPLPSEQIRDAGRAVREQTGTTYNPNIVPETTGERIGLGVGDAVGQVASTVIPGGIAAKAATAPVMGLNVAVPTTGQTVGRTLAAAPGFQVAGTTAGNLTTDFTGNPLLGLFASFSPAALVHGATRIPFAAPARSTAEAERRALLADAKKEGILPSFGTIQDSNFAKMFESVLDKLPFMGGRSAALNEGNKAAFNKATINKIPEVRGEGIDAMTAGNREMIGARIGKVFDRLEDSTTVKIDPQFGADIANAKADFSQQLRSQMPANILNKLDELQTAADALKPKPTMKPPTPSLDKYPSTDVSVWVAPPQPKPMPDNPSVTIDGETYKNIRSKLSAQLSSAKGTDKQAIGAMIDALDGAVERSLPKDMVKDWKDARTSWRRFQMVRGATDARHNSQTDVGHVPPGALAARVGGDKEMERLAQVGTSFVGDKTPDSGTASRTLIQNMLGLGAGAGVGSQFPMSTAALAGGGYLTNMMMNNPYTRRALVNRLQRSRQGPMSLPLAGVLAAHQGIDNAP